MFSFVMMAYNEEMHIDEAVRSVLAQGENIELIVVDDGSIDNTSNVVRTIAQRDKRVHLLCPGHIGKNAAANLGVSKCVGDWVCLVAADDIIVQGTCRKVQTATNGVDPCSERIAVFSQLKMFSEDKRYDGVRIPKDPKEVHLAGSYAYMSRALVEDMFPIPENLPNEDGWSGLYYRYLLQQHISVYDITVLYRIHSGNSLDKNAPFKVFNEAYHKRASVAGYFIDRYRTRLTDDQIAQISMSEAVERLRYEGKTLTILLYPGLKFTERARNVFLSNSVLYAVKLYLNRFLIGHQ